MAETYLNGFFFEYDDRNRKVGSVKGIQYKVVTDLVTEPIDLAFFKAHARIDFNMDDSLATSYIKAARQELERFSQLSFGNKTMRLLAKELTNEYRLMYGPVIALIAPLSTWTLLGDIISTDYCQSDVTIEYEVGWGAAGLPEAIKIAIAQTAAGLYANRENIISEIDYRAVLNQAKKTVKLFRNEYFL